MTSVHSSCCQCLCQTYPTNLLAERLADFVVGCSAHKRIVELEPALCSDVFDVRVVVPASCRPRVHLPVPHCGQRLGSVDRSAPRTRQIGTPTKREQRKAFADTVFAVQYTKVCCAPKDVPHTL
jgi:hypothetical protein